MKKDNRTDVSLVIAGKAGQGIQTVEQFLVSLLHKSGYYVFSTKEYMSRVRGGSNSTEIRVYSSPVSSFVDRIDILVLLDEKSFEHVVHRVNKDTIIIGDESQVSSIDHSQVFSFDLLDTAAEIGNKVYANMIAVGLLVYFFDVSSKSLTEHISNYFQDKSEDIISKNITAVNKGKEFAKGIDRSIEIPKNAKTSQDLLLLNGTQSIGLGAIAGGCNFVASYPMSPSTGVLTFLAQHGIDADVFVEQAEDEIAAINMALGAWYAGARALVTTSGGGFALMSEGLSLAAITETPVVIHLAQRPGPATGLPTRTEQGDLQLALYAGHGEFPRIIFAPGSLQQAFDLTRQAFNIADRFQIPVIILSDQYFVDSKYQTKPFTDVSKKPRHHYIKTSQTYKRYKVGDSAVSSRGIPGYGDGFIHVDSDEHDENGRITEDARVRTAMNQKRLQKIKLLQKNCIEPELFGAEDYDILLIAWGSNLNVIEEARKLLAEDRIAFLHFSQVFPLHIKTKKFLQKANWIINIENNATAQFAELIKRETNVKIDANILQYNGHPFSIENLCERISQTIETLEDRS